MSYRWRFIWFIIAVIVASTLDQTILAAWPVRFIDLTMIVLFLGTFTGLVGPAVVLAVVAGFLRSTTTLFPWFTYGLAYGLAIGVAWVIIRRVVAERSTASLLAASLAGSAAYAAATIGIIALSHALDPHTLTFVWSTSLWSGVAQVLIQPAVIWIFWRGTGGGKFASVQDSLSRPF